MSSESNSKIQGTQSGKPTSRRVHRANRPVLVTEKTGSGADEPIQQAIEVAMQPEVPVAVETSEPVERKRRPGFFANIGRTEKDTSEKKADPQVVRMARAMRGKGSEVSKEKEAVKEKKVVATSSSARPGATPTRPRSGFKMRYIIGMMAYLLIADFL